MPRLLPALRPALVLSLAAAVAIGATVSAPEAGAKPKAGPSSQVRKACAADYYRLCPGLKVGSKKLRGCMRANLSQLSSGCISALISSGQR